MNNPSYVTDATAYVSPLSQVTTTVIKRPSYYPPIVVKKEDVAYLNNFLVNDATQFATRYIYRDYEYSVIGAYSILMPRNDLTQVVNYIQIDIPTSEYIDQDILEVELIVRFGNTSAPFIIHTWDRTAIDAHNLGTALTFDFYNDIAGNPVDSVSSAKPFDNVPLLAETLEVAKNRLFFANIKEGYDTPTASSLTTSIITVEDGETDLIATWKTMTITFYQEDDGITVREYYFMNNTSLDPSFYYFNTEIPPAVPSDPIAIGSATFSTNSIPAMADYLAAASADPYISYDWYQGTTPYTSTISGATVVLEGRNAFKSNGNYMIATWFFDEYRRKCGVVYSDANKLKMPQRTYAQSVYNVGVNWTLSNDNALTEIPDWAYYYCVGRTKCLTTDFFLEARCKDIKYVDKDNDGVYTYTATTYATTHYGVGIDISSIIGFGMGYVYQEGDLVNLFLSSGSEYQFSILAQEGKWLILNLQDIGATSGTPLFEIYTPYRSNINEFFYEVGEILQVVNGGTSARLYSALTGTLNGDVFLIKRETTYFTENMSPNDKYWTKWETDIGWPNLIDKIGQKQLPYQGCFSDVYIQGAKSNGLSSFGALNTFVLDSSNGSIFKLQLTTKTQVDGSVMLAICENETISMYLGEQQIFDTQGSAFIAAASNVVGSTKSLRGSFGTRNPESVVEFRGNVFWYDVINGKYIQYGANGLFPISNYKMTRFWKLFSDLYSSMTVAEIEALGSRPFVFSTVDPYHMELLVSIPKLSNTPPKGYLPDYPDDIFPFDIWDAQGKTIVYKLDLGEGRPSWAGAYKFNPENFISFENKLYSFKNGHLYLHNQTENYNEFYGVQYTSKIMVISNALPNKPKTYNNITSESNLVPSFVYLYNNYPIQQSSDLVDNDFRNFEGNFYSTIFRNKLVPTAAGYTTDGLMTGEKMRNVAMWIMFEWRVTAVPLELKYVDIGFSISKGNPI